MNYKIFTLFILIIISNYTYADNKINFTVQEINSEYGIKAWLYEDNTTPIISMILTFKHAGYAYDTKPGTSALITKLLLEGAGEYDGNTIADLLESNGIILSYDTDLENFIVRIKTLSKHIDTALLLLQSMLTAPHLEDNAIERAKSQQISLIKKSIENPRYIAQRKFFAVAFENHPYMKAQEGNLDTINEINKDDMISYVQKSFNRFNLNISVAGDIKAKNLSEALDKYLINLPLVSHEVKEIKKISKLKIPDTKKVHVKMNIPQTAIYFGKLGIDVHDPHFYAAYILNRVVGGQGLDSIMMEEIRKKRGLTYGIYTQLANYQHANIITGWTATDYTNVNDMISSINKVFNSVNRDGITLVRFQNATDYIINSFISNLDTNSKVVEMLSYAQENSLSIDYLNNFCSNIKKVTIQDLNKVANNLLNTNDMLFVTVGQ